jgi:hypothetical protein
MDSSSRYRKERHSGDRATPGVAEGRQRRRAILGGGAFAGESTIDLDLLLTDQASGQVLARPRVARSADAMTGAWSIGQSDDNLLDYITGIAYQYLVDSY